MTGDTYKTDLETLIKAINRRNAMLWRVITKKKNYQWFRNLWDADADAKKFFELYSKERKELGLDAEEAHFDKLWQYHMVLNQNLEISLSEWAEMLVQ